MVDLLAMYEAHGLTVQAHELPDYIPAFLEFLSVLDTREMRSLIAETAHILRALGDRLAERGSGYAAVFAAVLALGRLPGLNKAIRERVAAEPDRSALDAQWMDPEVTFGPGPQTAPVRFYRNGVAA